MQNYNTKQKPTHIQSCRTNHLTFPKWGKGDHGVVDEDV